MPIDAVTDRLPEGLRWLGSVLGWRDAMLLARHCGGLYVYIAERPRQNEVVRAIGPEAAKRLVEAIGPGWLEIPMMPRDDHIRRAVAEQMIADGESLMTAARASQMTLRNVRKIATSLPRAAS